MKKKKQKTKPAAETREKSPPAGEKTPPSEEAEQPSMAARPPFPEEEKSGEQAEKIQELSAEPAEEPAQANSPAEEAGPEAAQPQWTVTARERRAARRAEKARQKEALQAKKHTQRELVHRKPNVSRRQAKRLSRQRKRAARCLGTPGRYQTGLPTRRHPLRAALMVLLVLGIAGGTAGFFVLDVPNWQPLDVSRITAAPQTGRMYDGDGQLIMTIKGSQNRVVIPLDDIPVQTRNVFLAAEDLRFYRHHGVDMVRLFGALAANIREGGYSQGASTITMQLIRQSHLSTKKTLSRKAEEIWLAWQLERRMSKDDILAMYLNYIYFGNGAYGIQAAAQTYFGVDARDLTLTQACALAASIKAPSYYAPHVSAQHNRSRRNYILNTMLEEGMIDQQTRDEAAAETLVLAEVPPEEAPYGWYADAVLDEAETLLGMTSEEVLSGGLSIDTALSRTHQDLLDKQFTADIFPANASDGTKVQGAAACVDTNTGEVLAIVGGRSYDVRRGFNRATRLRRQPGSALKPLAVYAPAIDRYGYMTCSVLKDEPTNFNGYKPRNSSYTYYGNVSIRTALKNSLNVSTVALLNQIGVNAGRDYMASVGIPLDDRDANLALGLGAMTYGVSPVQLAAAYAPFGNGGTYNAPHLIRRITDASGRVLYQNRDSGSRVLKATSAYLMTSLLQTVTASGTGAKLSGAGTPVAGKTGTVNMTGGGNRDIWMACYNSEISCAFWMGFDEPDQKHKLQGWVSGGDNTAAMARNYFKALYQNRDKPQFTRPGGIIALEIDQQAIKWRGEPMLANDLTPKTYRYTEYFAEDNHPTKKSDVWTPPRALNSFTVSHSEAGYPVLILQPADTALYRVQRDAVGESFILTELYGSAGETLYFTDMQAKAGVVYTYRVIPVHAELLNNGVLLEGVQSVQVAQANLSTGFWDSVKSFFTGGEQKEDGVVESLAENERSIFWGN